MNYGVIKRTETYHKDKMVNVYVEYRDQLKVADSQEEMTEFLRFTGMLAELRSTNKLYVDWDDKSTHPWFGYRYPKEDVDGAYFVSMNWCEKP